MEKLAEIKFWYEKIVSMDIFLSSKEEERKACFGGLSMYAKKLILREKETLLDAYLKDFCSPDNETEDSSSAASKNYQRFVFGFGNYMATKTQEQLAALAVHGEKLHYAMLTPSGTECLTKAFLFPEKIIYLLMLFSVRAQAVEDDEIIFDDLNFLPPALQTHYYQKGLTCTEDYKNRRNGYTGV